MLTFPQLAPSTRRYPQRFTRCSSRSSRLRSPLACVVTRTAADASLAFLVLVLPSLPGASLSALEFALGFWY